MTDRDFEVRVDASDLARLVQMHEIYQRQVGEAHAVIVEQRERIEALKKELAEFRDAVLHETQGLT